MSWLKPPFELYMTIAVSLAFKDCWLTAFAAFIACQWMPRVGHSAKGLSNILSYMSYYLLSLNLLSSLPMRPRCMFWDRQGAVCWIPLPLFCFVCAPSAVVLCHVFSASLTHVFVCRACRFQKHVFGTSSLAAALNTLPGGVFRRPRCITAPPGLLFLRYCAIYYQKTIQQ